MKYKSIGRFFILFGIMSNAVVTEVNGGVMPAVGLTSTIKPESVIWQPAVGKSLLMLADQAKYDYFSIGDALLLFGAFLILSKITYVWFSKRRQYVKEIVW